MTPDPARWSEIRRLLQDARERPEADRATFLDAIEDDALRADVAALLEHDEEASSESFLDSPAADRSPGLFSDASDSYVGRRIGPWRLAERLGEGGMGVVYRAERADADFYQEAALKLVGRGLAPRALLDRFRQERRILAGLEHPHIARLLDGGLSDDGQPYFAMELVRGEPITAFAEARQLDVRERLALFLDVCEAVAYAHRSLVVHRDLKPSNVVVEGSRDEGGMRDAANAHPSPSPIPYPSSPTVKLLDFGIAKVLTEDADDGLPLTLTGGQLMTPAYAAPEQVTGAPVTTATDVYALGVLLFELLAGQRPYDVEPGAPPTTVERIVCETAPPRPSALAPEGRQRALRSNLDTIALKALEKEPARRYPTADALAADIRRHLDGLPITARRATTAYRVGSFVRRHPVGVGLTALAALALLLGMAGTTWQARVAQAERDRAQIETAKAEEIRDYVLGLFAVSNPDSAQGRTMTVRELLDAGAARVADELADQPIVRADMELTIALLYRRLGLYTEARPHVESAIALREEHLGADHPETGSAYRELGLFLTDVGEYAASRDAASRAHDIHRAALGPDDPETLASLSTLATALVEVGEMAQADSALTELVARWRGARDSAALGEALYNLGSLRHRQLRFAEAEPPLRESVTLHRALYGDVHSSTANSLNSLGLVVARGEGDMAEAERLLNGALRIRRQLYGDRHPEVAQMLNNLARLYEEKGDLVSAERTYDELVPLVQEVLGYGHPNTGIVLVNYGSLLRKRGRTTQAERFVRDGLAVALAANGRDHPNTALSEIHLAHVLIALGRTREARPLVVHAAPILESTFGPDAPPTQLAREAQNVLG